MNEERYKDLISKDFPNLIIDNISYLGSGWDNAALLVNGEYVFRFLRGLFDEHYPLKTGEIEKEVNILNFLQGRVSFAVPKPDFVAPNFSYFGYKLIAGTLWDKTGDGQLSDDYLRSWVKTRSQISKAVSKAEARSLKITDYRTDKNEQLIKDFLADSAADQRVKDLAQAAMDYVCTRCAPADNWVFIHEDLQLSNCMVDENTRQITGVIDWLEAEIGPIEAEFYFWSKYGSDKLETMAKLQEEYDGTKIDIMLARAIHQFYIVADYQDFKTRGFTDAAAHKWRQIEAYLST